MGKSLYHYIKVVEGECGVTVACPRLVSGSVEQIQNCVMCPSFVDAAKFGRADVRVTCAWPSITRAQGRRYHSKVREGDGNG